MKKLAAFSVRSWRLAVHSKRLKTKRKIKTKDLKNNLTREWILLYSVKD